MAKPDDFGKLCVQMAQSITALMQQLETIQDRMAKDPTLAAAAAAALGRSDLAAIDFTNFDTAIGQLIFTFNSGTPTQSSYIYKFL